MAGGAEWKIGIPWSSKDNLFGRLSKVGGTLVLTDDELIVKPLAFLGSRKTIPLSAVSAVQAVADHPPRLRIEARDRQPITLMVVSKRSSTIASSDTSARDDAVAQIRRVLAA